MPARQVRSLDAIQRLSEAARTLLAEREYDTISVADIAKEAGMSVGAFYTRFESKEHLVVHLLSDLSSELRDSMANQMSEAAMRDASTREVVRTYLNIMAAAFVTHRSLLRPASLVARQTRDERLRDLLRRFNNDVHARFRELLLRTFDSATAARRTMHVDVAILTMSAAMREVLLYGEPVSRLSSSHDELIAELTTSAVLYLEGAPHA